MGQDKKNKHEFLEEVISLLEFDKDLNKVLKLIKTSKDIRTTRKVVKVLYGKK